MDQRLFGVLLVFLLFWVNASTLGLVHADYTVSLTDGIVRVEISQHIHQNATSFPTFNVSIAITNASTALPLFDTALQAKVPGARVTGIFLRAISNVTDFDVHATLNVTGVSKENSGTVTVNMAWRSFVVVGEPVEGLTINDVGAKVLFQPVDALLIPATAQGNARAFINGTGPVRFDQIREKTMGLSMLSFSVFSRPLLNWVGSYDLRKDLTDLTTMVKTNLRIIQTEIQPEPAATFYDIFFENKAKIEVPGFASVSEDQIVTGREPFTIIMVAVVVSTLGIWIGAFLVERKINPKDRRRQKRR